MQLHSAILTLLLVMDPIGNVPAFLSHLKCVDPRRRSMVVVRESCIALAILLLFLLCGPALMGWLAIDMASLHIAGGVLLFLISVGMIFPGANPLASLVDAAPTDAEPFVVPLATPLLAGPSTFATIMILTAKPPGAWPLLLALVVAWGLSTVILLLSARLSWLLGRSGLEALQRMTGMILTVIAVQMLLNGISLFAGEHPALIGK